MIDEIPLWSTLRPQLMDGASHLGQRPHNWGRAWFQQLLDITSHSGQLACLLCLFIHVSLGSYGTKKHIISYALHGRVEAPWFDKFLSIPLAVSKLEKPEESKKRNEIWDSLVVNPKPTIGGRFKGPPLEDKDPTPKVGRIQTYTWYHISLWRTGLFALFIYACMSWELWP